jgi:hypothetical protein
MIRQLRAFGWLRWRLLMNGVRGAKRRDTLEQISRMLALAAPLAVVVFSLGSLVTLSLGGFFAGRALATGAESGHGLVMATRVVLLVQLAIVAFMPLGIGTQTAAKYTRLLLLPIPRRVLHFVEVISGLSDPWIFVVMPGLVLLAVGLASGGAFMAAAVTLLAGAGLIALLLSVGALVSFLAGWVMRDRRRAELMTLLFVLGISMVGLLPHVFGTDQLQRSRDDTAAGRERRPMSVARVEAALPMWTRAIPSEMYGQAVSASALRRAPGEALLWTTGLWAQAAFVYLLSGVVHRRMLDAGEGQARRKVDATLVALPRVPLLSAAASAVAVAQFRTGLKSVRGRVAVLLPGPMIALLALVLGRAPEEAAWIAAIPNHGHLVFGASLLFAIYAIQPFSMNQFASDRAGLTLQLLLPVSARDLVWGKAVGTFGLFAAAGLLSLVVTTLSTSSGSWLLWLSVIVGASTAFVAMTPIAAAMSATFPTAADLSKTGSGGNPHGAAMLVGTILVPLTAAPAVLILLIGPRFSDATTLLAALIWATIVCAIVTPLLSVVTRLVTARRENLYLTR